MYSFFIIIDTNDPSSFWVEMTKMNYTFYLLDKRYLTSEQANQHKMNLIDHFKKNVKPASAGRDKFKVSF